MDKKRAVGMAAGIVIVILILILFLSTGTPKNADTVGVRDTVTTFGDSLKQVSLLVPADLVKQEMADNYTAYVAPELLAQWESDPLHAPGRLTPSPAPDRITISSVKKNADGTYGVSGKVVESTNTGSSSATDSGSYPVTMTLQNATGAWRITSFQGYPPAS